MGAPDVTSWTGAFRAALTGMRKPMKQDTVAMPIKLHGLRKGERVVPIDVTGDMVIFRYLLPITACFDMEDNGLENAGLLF
jgi:hypothetical protein